MTLYFDIRNGSVGVVETDTPDEGFIPVGEGQSTLALRYKVDDDNVIDLYEGKTDEEVLAQLVADAEAARQETPAAPRVMTKLAFTNRFTTAELVAIYTAAKTEVFVEVFLDKLKIAEEINLSDPNLLEALTAFVQMGLLAEPRIIEILA